MKVYRVSVEQENSWFAGRVLERAGVTTQGRTLDELVWMLRDAIAALWGEKKVQLELLVSCTIPGERAAPETAQGGRQNVGDAGRQTIPGIGSVRRVSVHGASEIRQGQP